MSVPHIQTAIPKRRYQYGEFVITVLGEVESDDPVDYHYIFAVGTESNPVPYLFLSAEKNPPNQRDEGTYSLRVSMPDGSQVIGKSDRWRELDLFVQDGLEIVAKLLNLSDETPHRLM